MPPTALSPFRFASRARARAAARPPAAGRDRSTSVYPLWPAGQTARAFGFGAGGTFVGPVAGSPGAVGRGPFVIVGGGAVGRFAGLEVGATVPSVAPGPTVTGVAVAASVGSLFSRAEFAATAAPVAITVSTRKKRTGQIQSPGYQASRRCQALASTPTTPRFTGSRSPHSMQYSWSGS